MRNKEPPELLFPCDICRMEQKADSCAGCIHAREEGTSCAVIMCIYNFEKKCTLGCSAHCKCSRHINA